MPESKYIDCNGLGDALLAQTGDLLTEWLPGGCLVGHEYTCGNLHGGPGRSLKVNIRTGQWSNFAVDNCKGGNLISLFAQQKDMEQRNAAKLLADRIDYRMGVPKAASKPSEPTPTAPPTSEPTPTMVHNTYGSPADSWTYRDAKGGVLFHVARYDVPGGKKFSPWSWVGGRWRQKGWPAPRPLCGLELLAGRPDAARRMAPPYVVVTWPNGSKAAGRASWGALKGRSVLIWPDADDPGKQVAEQIAEILIQICPTVKIIAPGDKFEGWDAADAKADGWDWKKLLT